MAYISQNTIIRLCAVACLALVGCEEVARPPQAAPVSSLDKNPKAETPEGEKGHGPQYITCSARFASLEKDHPWFDDSNAGHDDGRAPLASFVVVEPAAYTNRAIGILFNSASVDTAVSPDQADIGSQFTFQIPTEFFSGDHTTSNVIDVKRFRKVEP